MCVRRAEKDRVRGRERERVCSRFISIIYSIPAVNNVRKDEAIARRSRGGWFSRSPTLCRNYVSRDCSQPTNYGDIVRTTTASALYCINIMFYYIVLCRYACMYACVNAPVRCLHSGRRTFSMSSSPRVE